jgi:hypothetical protein
VAWIAPKSSFPLCRNPVPRQALRHFTKNGIFAYAAGELLSNRKSGEIFLGEMTAQQIVKKAAQRDFPRHK